MTCFNRLIQPGQVNHPRNPSSIFIRTAIPTISYSTIYKLIFYYQFKGGSVGLVGSENLKLTAPSPAGETRGKFTALVHDLNIPRFPSAQPRAAAKRNWPLTFTHRRGLEYPSRPTNAYAHVRPGPLTAHRFSRACARKTSIYLFKTARRFISQAGHFSRWPAVPGSYAQIAGQGRRASAFFNRNQIPRR